MKRNPLVVGQLVEADILQGEYASGEAAGLSERVTLLGVGYLPLWKLLPSEELTEFTGDRDSTLAAVIISIEEEPQEEMIRAWYLKDLNLTRAEVSACDSLPIYDERANDSVVYCGRELTCHEAYEAHLAGLEFARRLAVLDFYEVECGLKLSADGYAETVREAREE